jgi:hypothetical protein
MAARTQVLDYFFQLRSVVAPENVMFRWEENMQSSPAERAYIEQICLQMGYDARDLESYLTAEVSTVS